MIGGTGYAASPKSPNHRSLVHCTTLTVGLCGPAIGAFGIYGATVLSILAVPFFVVQHDQYRLVREQQLVLACGAALMIYILWWGAFSGGQSWSFAHLAIILLSGSAFMAQAVIANYRGAAHAALKWLCAFTWILLAIALCEILFGFRLPVSRYSPLAPTLGFAYEGHGGESPLIDGLWIPTGLFGNQNNLALAILCLLPFGLAAHRSALPRWMLLGLAGAVIFASESRVALLVGLGAAVAAVGFRFATRFPVFSALAAVLLGGALAALAEDAIQAVCSDNTNKVCFAVALAESVSLDDLELGSDSISVRYQLAMKALELWAQSPVLGVGPGHLGDLISALHAEGTIITDAHSAPLQILVEYGLLGTCLWALAITVIVQAVLRMKRHDAYADRFRRASIWFLCLLPFASVTVSTMYYFVPVWVLAGLVFGVSLSDSGPQPVTEQ